MSKNTAFNAPLNMAKALIKALAIHRDGYTLTHHGEDFTHGYIVGGYAPELSLSEETVNAILDGEPKSAAPLMDWISDNWTQLHTADCVGYWYHDGNVVFDANELIYDRTAAIWVGEDREQHSIRDVANEVNIEL